MTTINKKLKLTKTIVENAKTKEKRYFIHDTEVDGLSLKIEPTGSKTYVFEYRVGYGRRGKSKRLTIGKSSKVNLGTVKDIAREYNAKISLGDDPSEKIEAEKNKNSFKEAIDRFYEEHTKVHNKEKSISNAKVKKKSLTEYFKNFNVEDVEKKDVKKFMYENRHRPIQANRCLAYLSIFMNHLEDWGIRPDNTNPCKRITKYPENKRDRYLSDEELNNLLDALNMMEEYESLHHLALFRLIIYTGARVGEIRTAKWSYVDYTKNQLNLPDSKTGKKVIDLSPDAMSVLNSLTPIAGNEYIIASNLLANAPINNPKKLWKRILSNAGIEDLRIHDLRHSWASFAVRAGLSLPEIGEALGHSSWETTKRYAHLADEQRKENSKKVTNVINDITKKKSNVVKVSFNS